MMVREGICKLLIPILVLCLQTVTINIKYMYKTLASNLDITCVICLVWQYGLSDEVFLFQPVVRKAVEVSQKVSSI